MKAFAINEPGSASIVEIDKPSPAAGEVLLKLQYVGFCGSDLSTFRGLNPLVGYPRIPGHEIGATIEAVGADVPVEFSAGTNVLVLPYTACGECSSCQQDRPNCCQFNQTLGIQRDGAMAEYATVPWEKLMASSTLSLEGLALVEPLTVGFHAAARARVAETDTVAVFGCGAIGLGVIAGAATRGARVIAIDLDDSKLELAIKCGATLGINSGREDLHAAVARTHGQPWSPCDCRSGGSATNLSQRGGGSVFRGAGCLHRLRQSARGVRHQTICHEGTRHSWVAERSARRLRSRHQDARDHRLSDPRTDHPLDSSGIGSGRLSKNGMRSLARLRGFTWT